MTYIEREALIEDFDKIKDHDIDVDEAIERIADFPAADVAPVKHGRFKWERADSSWATYACTVCGFCKHTDVHVSLGWNYCPRCGAKMDLED